MVFVNNFPLSRILNCIKQADVKLIDLISKFIIAPDLVILDICEQGRTLHKLNYTARSRARARFLVRSRSRTLTRVRARASINVYID